MRNMILIAIFLMLVSFPVLAEGQAVLKIENANLKSGETATVKIEASGVSNLANFDITVEYNPSIVTVINVENNPAFGTPIVNMAHAFEGSVRIATINLEEGQNGDVLLSTLTLKAGEIDEGSSNLSLKINTFVDSSETDIPVTIQNGKVSVSASDEGIEQKLTTPPSPPATKVNPAKTLP